MNERLRTLTILALATMQVVTGLACAPMLVAVANCECATPEQLAPCCCCDNRAASHACMCNGEQVPEPQPAPAQSERDDERQLIASGYGGEYLGHPPHPRFADTASRVISAASHLSTSTQIALCTWQT